MLTPYLKSKFFNNPCKNYITLLERFFLEKVSKFFLFFKDVLLANEDRNIL